MKSFNEWLEAQFYQPNSDGPPLNPTSIAGAENQIRALAGSIQLMAGDHRFPPVVQQSMMRSVALLQQAANGLAGDDEVSMGARSIKID